MTSLDVKYHIVFIYTSYIIVTKGPKEGIIEDFWRMVWEHSIPTIIMLTRVFEEKVKTE